jgi:signal transduction histidine kinase
MQTSIRAVNNAVVAAVAAASDPSDWIALLDEQQHCVHLQRGELGEIPEKLIGMQRGESGNFVANGRDSDLAYDLVTDVLRRGAHHEVVRVYDDPQLGPRIFEYQFRPWSGDAGVAAVVISCNEATAQRATMQAARLQSHVLEAMNDGVLLVGADSVVKMFNPAAQLLLGWQGRPLVGESVGHVSAALASAVQRLSDLPVEIEVPRGKQEDSVFIECSVRQLRINNSLHRLAILRDVSGRRRLEREIVDIEQRERRHIGRELHDGLGQELTGLALMLRGAAANLGAGDAAIGLRLQEAVGIVNNLIASTRELTNGVFAVSIPGGDLASALNALATTSSARSGVAVRFQVLGSYPLSLTEQASSGLFRIAQEATTNALRHSGAASIAIVLGVDAAGVSLTVTDDGVGCPADAEQSGGAGLRIMRFRAHALGAQLRVAKAPGRGTKIECSLPMT